MEFTDERHQACQGTCQDTNSEPSRSAPDLTRLTINRLPDEVLLEIFDCYRKSTDLYDYQWKKKYVWFNLAHVCTRWRAVMFTSSFRLDLSITVGPKKPGHIKTVLSSPLPISIEYRSVTDEVTGSAIWRMRAALKHRDRVREISFGWQGFHIRSPATEPRSPVAYFFKEFIRAANFHFPALVSLTLYFIHGHEPEFPATFLRGPDQSDLRLRSLELYEAPIASLSGLLLSATALTDFTLTNHSPNAVPFDPSRTSLLLQCLQGMQCLRSLDITTPYHPRDSQHHHPTPAPKDIVPLSKLTRFYYSGSTTLWNNLMSGLSAPSLQDAQIMIGTGFPLLYLTRVIDDMANEFQSIEVTFGIDYFYLFSSESIHSTKITRPPFMFDFDGSLDSIKSISSTPSTKLAMVEKLSLVISSDITNWEHNFSLREFLHQFRSVRVLRVNPFTPEVGLYLHEDGTLPLLEEIELSISRSTGDSDEYQRRAAEALAAFEPLASARERAGSVVKVYLRELE